MDEIDLEKFKELVEGLPIGANLTLNYDTIFPNHWSANLRNDHTYYAIGHTLAECCHKLQQQTGMKARTE